MNVLVVLVPVSFALSALALFTFLWTLRNAQYDDLEGDPCRIIFDDEPPENIDEKQSASSESASTPTEISHPSETERQRDAKIEK